MQDDSKINDENTGSTEALTNEDRIKLLARIVCICKGINLGRVLKGLEGSETVEDVNRKTGCGTGGCRGERCGPRIKQLLRKKKQQ
jgi:NAD(P)H-nitrite reductase large subunit